MAIFSFVLFAGTREEEKKEMKGKKLSLAPCPYTRYHILLIICLKNSYPFAIPIPLHTICKKRV
jgi:hypothetical protein